MVATIKSALTRATPSLAEDVLGVASLFLILFVGLTLSGAA